ncbi:MAG: hypothetical protein Q4E87_08995, partial [bacterium]|nr:hypothetical protein [bacterium]
KSENSEFTTNAQEIWNHKSEKPGKHYNYGSTGVTNFDFNSAISTYNANQSKDKQAEKNLPVLQVSSGNADVVADYINILTNGGFAKANACNTSSSAHVSARVNICELKNGKFVIKDVDNTESLRVNVDANNRISFSTTTNYDNDKGRFTLLTVTFTEAGHTYNVQVPILVKRMLEMNFTATLSYGTNYRSKDYESIKSHVLDSFGSSITGYLTYTYDSDEKGIYTDFGWQSYMNAGGNVADAMKKSVYFAHNAENLPAGTQLSLINSLDGKVYYYTATGNEENKIPLSSFVNSDGENYQEPSIADLLHAKAKTDKNGLFVKTDANGKIEGAGDDITFQSTPTVKIKNGTGYDYYRLAASGETGNYTIEVDESSFESNHKSNIKESYFLVITVPKTAGNVALNGTIQTIIESDIPHQMNYQTIQGGVDDHTNTASSYQLSGGYQQEVKESSKITEQSKKL